MATQTFSIRLADEEREALVRAAQAEDRPVSSMARKIIMDWLRKQQKAPNDIDARHPPATSRTRQASEG